MRSYALLALVALLAAPAAAQPPPTPRRPTADRREDPTGDRDCAQARKAGRACVLTFGTGDTLDGDRPTGLGEWIDGLGQATHASLIRLRTSFRGEIIRSAEQL
jgi:hypothetical protein